MSVVCMYIYQVQNFLMTLPLILRVFLWWNKKFITKKIQITLTCIKAFHRYLCTIIPDKRHQSHLLDTYHKVAQPYRWLLHPHFSQVLKIAKNQRLQSNNCPSKSNIDIIYSYHSFCLLKSGGYWRPAGSIIIVASGSG